jgi:hypothetical protein
MTFDKITRSDERIELKFVYYDRELSDVLIAINSINGLTHSYLDRQVNSVYYDTAHFKYAKDNLIGLSSRKKTRLRFYKSLDSDKSFYGFSFEEKIKNNKLGYKLIYKSNNFNSLDILDLTEPITYNGDSLISNLHPVSYIRYIRSYYVYYGTVRLTIDKDIHFTSLFNAVDLSLNTPGDYFPRVIVEIKFDPSDYNIAKKLLNYFHRTPVRHSKYLSSLATYGYVQYV